MLRTPNRLLRISLLLVLGAAALSGCASLGAKSRARATGGAVRTDTRPVELVYNTGADLVDQKDWGGSIEYFLEVEQRFPATQWAARATLMEAYAHYRAAQYDDAISDAERYIRDHQGEASTAYAYYIRAVCYFDQIYDVGRDQAYTTQALDALRDITTRYGATEYAQDAKLKIDMVNDQLAGKEMDVGRYYLRDGKPLAAAGRFNEVVNNPSYQTSSHAPEALYRLVEVYLTLGLADEAKRDGAILGYNYPGDQWYADAYKLLTDNGLQPTLSPTNRADQRNALQRLFTRGSGLAPPAAKPLATPVVSVTVPAATPAAPAATTAAKTPAARKSLLSRILGR